MASEPVTLEQIKAHLRLDIEAGPDDEYLKLLSAGALRSIENATGKVIGDTWPTLQQRDQAVVATAMLMLVGHWFVNREAVGKELKQMPMAVEWLLHPLKSWSI